MRKGLFIAIEGNDGSGKATQARLLVSSLEEQGRSALKVDFPAYETNVMGAFIGECLAGKHGDFLHLDPKIASMLYAIDRAESSPTIRTALEEGKVVVADRFSSSNNIHQGGKVENAEKRRDLISWLDHVEHDILSVPRPDHVIYLRVPVETSSLLLSQERETKNKHVGEEGKDTVEQDTSYMQRSFDTANWLAEHDARWHTIECAPGGAMRSREDIHEEVQKVVAGILEAMS